MPLSSSYIILTVIKWVEVIHLLVVFRGKHNNLQANKLKQIVFWHLVVPSTSIFKNLGPLFAWMDMTPLIVLYIIMFFSSSINIT